MSAEPQKITEVVSRNIKPSHLKDYDDWLRSYMKLESEVTGYLGTTIIAPGGSSSSVRYVMDSFADKASLCAGKFRGIAQANRRSGCSTYDRVTGLETWLSLPDLKTIAAPSRWKMAIVTFTGV